LARKQASVAAFVGGTGRRSRLSNRQGLGKTPRDPLRSPVDDLRSPIIAGIAGFYALLVGRHADVSLQ
jgi:hypothetical protein